MYDTRYYYDIDKWEYERSEVTSGTDKSPYWATLELTDKEREKNITYDIQESWWREIKARH